MRNDARSRRQAQFCEQQRQRGRRTPLALAISHRVADASSGITQRLQRSRGQYAEFHPKPYIATRRLTPSFLAKTRYGCIPLYILRTLNGDRTDWKAELFIDARYSPLGSGDKEFCSPIGSGDKEFGETDIAPPSYLSKCNYGGRLIFCRFIALWLAHFGKQLLFMEISI
jgi:hypothetical protein